MSGISGFWGFSGADLPETVFSRLTRNLAHRGPDGFGIKHFPERRLWLGHHRLATLNRSEHGRQPMSYANQRYWITHDGAIYNYRELRDELRQLGHRFVSETDGEVALGAFAEWGPQALLRLNGMWAFAIWDALDQQLFLSRDRFGVKPLFYSLKNGALTFASELKAFLALPWIDGSFDPDRLSASLVDVDMAEASCETLLPKVHRLPPGHTMLVDPDGNTRIQQWWNTLDHLPTPRAGLRAQAEEFRQLMLDACRLRLQGDVPIAVEQSGGLDSSAISCAVANLDLSGTATIATEPRRAFVACFSDTSYDERNNASEVIAHTGMSAHFESVGPQQAFENIEQIIFDGENIFHFPRAGSWLMYRAMQRLGVRASLNGMDPDTLFASEPESLELARQAAAERLALGRYWELYQVLRGLEETNSRTARSILVGDLRLAARYQLARLRLLAPLKAVRTRIKTLQSALGSAASGHRPVPSADQLIVHSHRKSPKTSLGSSTSGMSSIQAKHFIDFHLALPSYLGNFDRAAMAHGVEVRMPFMDWRLVAYCFALPGSSKNGGGYTKRLLRLATEGSVPDLVRLRKTKTPFVSPFQEWTRYPAFKTWLLDLCSSQTFLDSPAWNGPLARTAVEKAIASDDSFWRIWPILEAHVLERTFVARARVSPNG